MAYDPVGGYTILFGGVDNSGYALNDTWAYENQTWTLLHPTRSPPARMNEAMAWDAADGYLVLFGGQEDGQTYSNDTWAFVHGTWKEISAAAGPSPRVGASMAWDSVTDRVVLFGGELYGTNYNDTWTYVGGNWTRSHPATVPPGRSFAAIGSDDENGELVLFGGWGNTVLTLNDTWSLSGGNWTQLALSPSPPARLYASMSYLPSIQSFVLFGGMNSKGGLLSDTWWFNAGAWVNESGGANPLERDVYAMATGPSCDCLLLFGGGARNGYWANGTWEYYSLNLSVTPSSGVGEVPFNLTFRSASSNAVLSTVNWTFGDGSIGSGLSVAHTFITVGNFTISVVASDAEGATANLSLKIRTVSALDLLAVATPLSGIAPLPISLAASAVGGQSPYSFVWSLDGQPLVTTPFANLTVSTVGSHLAKVTLRDGLNYSLNRSFAITVMSPRPVPLSVGILANRTGGPAPLSVALSSWESGGSPPYASAWSLGDGNTSTQTQLDQTFLVPGTYTIHLAVSDLNGDLGNASATVTVWAPLSVSATVSVPASSRDNAPLTANFTATVHGGVPPYTVIWEYGNGSGSVGSTTSHRFTMAGTYSVTVKALDATGANATSEVNVTVLPGAATASGGWVWTAPVAALLALVSFAMGLSTAVTLDRLRRQRRQGPGTTEGAARVDQRRRR